MIRRIYLLLSLALIVANVAHYVAMFGTGHARYAVFVAVAACNFAALIALAFLLAANPRRRAAAAIERALCETPVLDPDEPSWCSDERLNGLHRRIAENAVRSYRHRVWGATMQGLR